MWDTRSNQFHPINLQFVSEARFISREFDKDFSYIGALKHYKILNEIE